MSDKPSQTSEKREPMSDKLGMEQCQTTKPAACEACRGEGSIESYARVCPACHGTGRKADGEGGEVPEWCYVASTEIDDRRRHDIASIIARHYTPVAAAHVTALHKAEEYGLGRAHELSEAHAAEVGRLQTTIRLLGVPADNHSYPNLSACASGAMSGELREWTHMRAECRSVLTEVARLREALEFYANEGNTHPNGAHMTPFVDGKPDPQHPIVDRGRIARAALAGAKP